MWIFFDFHHLIHPNTCMVTLSKVWEWVPTCSYCKGALDHTLRPLAVQRQFGGHLQPNSEKGQLSRVQYCLLKAIRPSPLRDKKDKMPKKWHKTTKKDKKNNLKERQNVYIYVFCCFVFYIGTEHVNEHHYKILDVNMQELAKMLIYISGPLIGNKKKKHHK